jgi:hypothetical protein
MGFLNAVFEYVLAFAAGFFGHIVAHDFCEIAPMISQKIIEAAASCLPGSIHDRYLEEWRADLWDQPGALAKLWWSIGCLLSVYTLRRQSRLDYYRDASVEVVLSNGETVMADLPTMAVMDRLASVYFALPRGYVPDIVRLRAILFATKVTEFWWRRVGKPDYGAGFKLLRGTLESRPQKIALWINGVSHDLTDQLRLTTAEDIVIDDTP